jgi:hypothetical protein
MATSEYAISTENGIEPGQVLPARERSFGALCLAGGVIAAAGAIWLATADPVVAADRMSYPLSPGGFRVTEVIWALTHLLTFLGALALARAGFAGRGRAARFGQPLMLTGMALLVPCELAFLLTANSAESSGEVIALSTAIGIVATVAGAGFTLVGVAVLREGRWAGWARWTPLVAGVYELVVITAIAPLSDTAFLAGIAGWNVCLALLGAALWTTGPGRAARPAR